MQPIEILLVEDDDDDARLTMKSLRRDRLWNRIYRVEDGIQALQYLRTEGQYAQANRPDLVLLDLNMPRMGGHEVLKAIKQDATLSEIPVVILTTSDDEREIMNSYRQNANSYVTKPADLMQFRNAIQGIEDYWFTIVKLPNKVTQESVANAASR